MAKTTSDLILGVIRLG